METARVILVVVLVAGCVLLALHWLVALVRIARTTATIPTARAGLDGEIPDPPPSVCVIVPAHNEESVVAGLVRSLRAQDYPRMRVVLALDRCTDATEAAARGAIDSDPRFEVLPIIECPAGWAGKVHALQRGSETRSAADAELLLFADADTTFDPRCVRATVALLGRRRLDMLSLVSTLTSSRWYEILVQPAAGFELMRQYPLMSANRDEDRRAFANGQFMLFRANAYRDMGGHGAVRDEILEDVALARLAARHHRRVGVFLADRMLVCRMYPGWGAFERGWQRIYTEAANCKPSRLNDAAWWVRVCGTILPLCPWLLLALLATDDASGPWRIPLGAFALASVALWGAGVAWVYRLSRAPLWAFPGHVIGSWLVARILSRAGSDLRRGRPVRWGGREYVRAPR